MQPGETDERLQAYDIIVGDGWIPMDGGTTRKEILSLLGTYAKDELLRKMPSVRILEGKNKLEYFEYQKELYAKREPWQSDPLEPEVSSTVIFVDTKVLEDARNSYRRSQTKAPPSSPDGNEKTRG